MKIMPLSTRRSSTRGLPWLLGKKGFRRAAGRNSAWPSRALMNRPGLVPADEPTGNLDPTLSAEIMALFAALPERGTSVLVASHDLGLVKRMRKRVLVLDHGRLVDDISPEDLADE